MYHLYGIKSNIIFEHSTKLSFLISAKKKKKKIEWAKTCDTLTIMLQER